MDADRRASGFQIFCAAVFSASAGLYMYSSAYNSDPGTGWLIALAIAGGVILSVALIMSMMFRLTGADSAPQLLSDIFGRPIARMIMLFAAIYFAARVSQTVSIQCGMISTYLLEETPDSVIILAVLLCVCALFHTGMAKLMRTTELTALLLILPLLVLIIAGASQIDPGELRVLTSPDQGGVSGLLPGAIMTASGAECILFMLGSGKAKTDPLRPLSVGIGTVIAISAIMYILSVGTLTIDGISDFSYPLVEMSRIINIGGVALTERFDTLLIILRISAVLIQAAIFNYGAATALAGAFGLTSHRCFTFLLLPLELLTASLARGSFGTVLNGLCFYGFIILSMMIFPALLIAAMIRFRRNRREATIDA